MTSGVFHIVPLSDIIVRRDDRQRRDLTDIDDLADSIRRLGLIHPIVVTRDELVLVAGERRYTACVQLGWLNISVQYVDELDPKHLREIELEENIKRKDITWQDQVRAVTEYHELRKGVEPEWTMRATAEAIGVSPGYVTKLLAVAEEMERGNKLVIDAPKLSTAAGITERARARRDEAELSKAHALYGAAVIEPPSDSILNVDFTKWVDGPDPFVRFNLIHCDFPYGIEADNFNQGSAAAHGGYLDTKETWERLIDALAPSFKWQTPSSHLMFWFAMRKGDTRLYEPTAKALERMGWNLNPMPLIWMKSDGAGILPDPERGPRQIYETCFLGSRGDRKIISAVANAYGAPTVRERHMSEKPEPMLRHFFRMLVDENTVLLDPTCGSGSSLRAAESLGAKYVLGLEINGEFANTARDTLKKSRVLRAATEVVE